MKIFFITLLLASGLLGIIVYLDFIMGLIRDDFFWKAINPFRVMEPAEFVIILLFIFVFFMKAMRIFMKKKKKKAAN